MMLGLVGSVLMVQLGLLGPFFVFNTITFTHILISILNTYLITREHVPVSERFKSCRM
jgi:hypothetical protein